MTWLFLALLWSTDVERPLQGCERDVHQIYLREGEVLEGSVEQIGINVMVDLVDPDGRELLHVNNRDEGKGIESFLLVAGRSGQYQCVIRARSPLHSGTYRLKAAVRPQTFHDLAAVMAQILLADFSPTYEGNRGRLPRAVPVLEQALALCRDQMCEADALQALAYAHWYWGRDIGRAREVLVESLPLWRAKGDRWTEGQTLHDIGTVLRNTGDYAGALDYLQRAVALRSDETSELLKHDLANVYWQTGRLQEALEMERGALSEWKRRRDQHGTAMALTSLGNYLRDLGDPAEALKSDKGALEIWSRAGWPIGTAEAMTNIAADYEALSDRRRALQTTREALRILETSDFVPTRARAQQRIGSLLFSFGDLEGAARAYQAAIADFQSSGFSAARATKGLADVHAAQGKSDAALDAYRGLLRDDVDELVKMEARLGMARLEREKGRLASAQSVLDDALSSVELVRDRLSDINDRALYLAARQDFYDLSIDVRMRRGDMRGGFEMSERARARSLLDAVPSIAPLSLSEIQAQLSAEDMLVEYSLGQKESYVWLVTPSGVTHHVLPPARTIEQQAREVAELLPLTRKREVERSAARAATRLSQTLIAPIATYLGKHRLIVVADGALQYVPFAALPDPRQPEQPLLIEHEVVVVPSGSSIAVLRQRRASPSHVVAVMADPVLDKDDPRLRGGAQIAAPHDLVRSLRDFDHDLKRLPYSGEEAAYIGALARSAFVATGFEANKATAMSGALADHRIIHFATHALINSQRPELSGLVLSLVDSAGRPQDGFLRLKDIQTLRLDADLVVLSACRTALGRDIKREGLIGLARGFMYAGSPRVIASLWDVRDQATAELMKRFYANLLADRMRPAAALRAAQISMWNDPRWRRPFFWAAFVLQGEWR